MNTDLTLLLAGAIAQNASDVFISANATPLIKVEGMIRPLGTEVLDNEQARQLIYSVLTDRETASFEDTWELNKSLHLVGVGRFRVNVFRQRGDVALVARHINDKIPDIEQLGLPSVLRDLVMEERGLILVVGGTGTGKSTTLAAMIDYRNATSAGHILTIEDPIEFVYENKKSLVNQREVGMDTASFEVALKNALREAPDVILIGEVRDRATMKQALTYAETGHLCLATLHANNANQAIDRILNFFPEDAHKQLLLDLSLNLKAVISQRLCVGFDNKRVAAVELMIVTPYIADLIDQGRVDEIKNAMEKAKNDTSQTFDQALFDLVAAARISQEEALRQADSPNNLALRLRLSKTGAASGYPVKSEFTLDKKAPLEQYGSFRISPLKVEGGRPDAETVISEAIAHVLEKKGLRQKASDPDLDVQFVFGIKKTKGLALQPIADEQEAFEQYQPETERHVMLVVNVVDAHSHKPVYRLTASRREGDHYLPQPEVNQLMESLLATFPVGS
ncbi:MAG: PilT/PilU family type 4a pilus ATPase [Chromatiaceae bacterium]|jgi:twitching motility protein PilU